MFDFPLDATAMAGLPAVLMACVNFWLGYLIILAVPGPNILAVSAHAMVHGVRASLPLILAIACGVGLLLIVIHSLAGMAEPRFVGWLSGASVGLLFYAAYRISMMRGPSPCAGENVAKACTGPSTMFFGVLCGFTNPVTAAYFAAVMLGPERALFAPGMGVLMAASAVLLSSLAAIAAAVIFSRQHVRHRVRTHFRLFKFVAAGIIAGYGLSTAGKLAAPWLAERVVRHGGLALQLCFA